MLSRHPKLEANLNNQSPIVRQFREAAKSCNEWRDTLFYTVIIGLGIASTQWNLHISPSTLIDVAGQREFCRALAWSPGLSRGPVSIKNCHCAWFATMSADVANEVAVGLQHHNLPVYVANHPLAFVLPLIGIGVANLFSGGARNIYSAYKETLFDWPRKRLPPRKPRKKPVSERIKALWEGLKDAARPPLPNPGYVPAPVRRRTAPALDA
jgi:hypothetical protein